jgi:hypothetical protein
MSLSASDRLTLRKIMTVDPTHTAQDIVQVTPLPRLGFSQLRSEPVIAVAA